MSLVDKSPLSSPLETDTSYFRKVYWNTMPRRKILLGMDKRFVALQHHLPFAYAMNICRVKCSSWMPLFLLVRIRRKFKYWPVKLNSGEQRTKCTMQYAHQYKSIQIDEGKGSSVGLWDNFECEWLVIELSVCPISSYFDFSMLY